MIEIVPIPFLRMSDLRAQEKNYVSAFDYEEVRLILCGAAATADSSTTRGALKPYTEPEPALCYN